MKKFLLTFLYPEPEFEPKVFEEFQTEIWYLNTKRIKVLCFLGAVLSFVFTSTLDIFYYFSGKWPNDLDALILMAAHFLITAVLFVFYLLFRSISTKSANNVYLQKSISWLFVVLLLGSSLLLSFMNFRTTGNSMTFIFVECFLFVAFYWNLRQMGIIYLSSLISYLLFLLIADTTGLVIPFLINLLIFTSMFFVLSRSLYRSKVQEFKMMIKLQENTENLKERNFELDQFVYKATHDIRAPLTSILGLINVIKLDQQSVDLHKYILLIEDRAVKLDDFIKSMLDFSRSAKLNLIISEVNLDQIVNQCLEELQYHDNFSRIKFTKKINLKEPFFNDVFRLTIILKNLISNSVKYLDTGKEENYIEISVLPARSENIIIRIKDNGIGIKRNYIENLFKMFYRAHTHSEGAGLGLYIVKQTVKKLKGKITVESEVAEGTEFRIILPNFKNVKEEPFLIE